MPTSVFISYSRSDGRTYAAALYEQLRGAGIGAWLDQCSVSPYADNWAQIEAGIRDATHVVVCVTPSIETSPESFVRREIGYALAKRKPILPLVFRGATVPIQINHLTHLVVGSVVADFPQIRALLELPAPGALPPPDPCRRYLMALLEQIEAFLRGTTFSIIPLRSRSDPAAVEPAAAQLPVRIVSYSRTVRNPREPPPEPEVFAELADAFERYGGSVLLLGEPGSGKSTMLWNFARDRVLRRLADPAEPLPVLAQVPSWDQEARPGLVEWLHQNVGEMNVDLLVRALDSGRALLLLDGLDEMGSAQLVGSAQRDSPRSAFLRMLPRDTPMVVACRVKDYGEMERLLVLRGAVVLQPLEDEQIEEFTLREAPALWTILQSHKTLLEAVRNPLVLSVLTSATEPGAESLAKMGHAHPRDWLFDLYLQGRYEHEALKPYPDLPFTLPETVAVLVRLAIASVEVSDTRALHQMDLADVRRALDDAGLPDSTWHARRFADFAVLLHALLPNPNGSYRFLHLLFRDSLGLQGVRSLLRDASVASRKRIEAAIRHFEGEAVDEATAEILASDDDLRFRRTVADALVELRGRSSIPVLVSALRTADVLGHAIATDGLRQVAAVDDLLRLLQSRNPRVRRAAAYVLGVRRERPAVVRLIGSLSDGYPEVRQQAARALGRMGDPRAVPPLIGALRDVDAVVRSTAAEGLGELGDARAAEPLMRCLEDVDLRVRSSACTSLGRLGDRRAAGPLRALLAHASPGERAVVAEALAALRSPH